jgi:hypothetical protein
MGVKLMKLLQTIFVGLLALESLVSMAGLIAAQQKEQQPSGSVIQHEGQTGQTGQSANITAPHKVIDVMREYRGIKLGMKRDVVRDELGKPELSDQAQDSFKIGGEDRITTLYDNDTVKMIQLYFFESKKVPSWADVVGTTEIEQNPDGSKIARVEVPEENFWVSMSQSKGGDVITVTISRFR